MPERLRLSRAKGWRKPEDAVVVARPTRWGNPFNWKDCPPEVGPSAWARGAAVDMYREWLARPEQAGLRAAASAELSGRDLLCWCPLDGPCHADVLLELTNRREAV